MSQCNVVVYGGSPTEATPCFNLGVGSGLFIHDFRTDGSLGSWLLGAGGNTVVMNNITIATIGGVKDGRDYYIVHFATPTTTLIVRNSQLRGLLSDSHVHGINIGTNTMGNTIIQDPAKRFLYLLHSHMNDAIYGNQIGDFMADKSDVWLGTLSLMILTTLETMGPLHGYRIARRIEQTSGDVLSLNYGTVYPALLKLEQEGAISSEWGPLRQQS
jgi:hypothetical protein